MKNAYKLTLAAIAASISLVGCGSSSVEDAINETINDAIEDVNVTGQFVDTYVSGLNYSCSSGITGVTDNMGYYTCLEGDTVTFSLGGYVLGSTTASSGIVTPEDITESAEAELNVAQLLQSLDADPTDDIITIPENFTALDDVDILLDDPNFDDLMETELEITLVTEEEAQIHLDEAELTVLLAGNTFYLVGSDNTGDNWIDSVVFNSDATSLTWASLTDSETGSHSVVIEGNTITLDGDEGPFTLTFIEEASDKLVFHGIEGGAIVEEDFMFFEQADAEAYYNTLVPGTFVADPTPITQAMLDGKTFYDQDFETDQNNVKINDIYAQMTFSNGVITRTELYVNVNTQAETVEEFTLPYTIIDGKIKVDLSLFNEGYSWVTLNSESTDAWNVTMEDDRDADGVIDTDSAEIMTWYLSKPADYPAAL